MRNKKGFTLAETLITIAIIGVVAAVTMSALVKNYQKKVTAERVKKSYAELSQVIQMAIAEHGYPTTWDYWLDAWSNSNDLNQWVETYIVPYVDVEKKSNGRVANVQFCKSSPMCPHLYNKNCKKNSSTSDCEKPWSNGYVIQKRGGASKVWVITNNSNKSYSVLIRVLLDVKDKNYNGYNVFTFEITKSGGRLLPFEYTVVQKKGDSNQGHCLDSNDNRGYMMTGDGCAAFIMRDGWKITYPW